MYVYMYVYVYMYLHNYVIGVMVGLPSIADANWEVDDRPAALACNIYYDI